ncbi:MAG: maleylpyruvate isomerase family mycothiol-dependent enzyme [Rhodococcus sp. (in: high G+C Gram-positive bacteria)]|uniref:maleylpyruvate isomerase family mycothiol-dependent enzyme n=1 Tax=Rhodococcus sp. TaxID=1831 RepID=UPI003BB104BF
MDTDESWKVIAVERRGVADLLESLTEDQWNTPSLADGWRVRDVAAHLALAPQPPSVGAMIRAGLRAFGSFDRMNHDVAVRYATERTYGHLVEELREHADSRRLPAVTNYRNILFDVLVHGQDIAVPLGIDRPMPLAAARTGADRVWSMGWPFWAKRKLRGHRLIATDIEWEVGSGEEIREPIASLLMRLTGRVPRLD